LCGFSALLRRPRAIGQLNAGDVFAARVAAGDPSVLHDALVAVAGIIESVRREVAAHMDDVVPTSAAPGSAEKVAVLTDRAAAGRSLFSKADSPIDVSQCQHNLCQTADSVSETSTTLGLSRLC